MAVPGVAIVFSALLGVLAFRANGRFKNERRLPMQWWLTGEVTWWASRGLALAFIPAVGTATLGTFVVMSLTLQPRAGQAGSVLPVLIGVGATFVVAQIVHLWLAARTLRRNAR